MPHTRRPRLAARFPVHVTWRFAPDVKLGHSDAVIAIAHQAIQAGGNRETFRVVAYALLDDHLHMVDEASSEQALARGMQGLGVRLARRFNRHLGRRGRFMAERYHARILRTPREVRAALYYVLNNRRIHAARQGRRLPRYWIDPRSSAPWFDGWRESIRTDAPWIRRLLAMPRPTAQPRTWLLRIGWRMHGLLGFDEDSDPG